MNNWQIDKLLCSIAQGSEQAFETLYLQTKKGVFAFVYSYLNNREDTEDVMQTVYLKIKLNISKYAKGTNGRAWILQIAKNLALDCIRKRYNTESIDDVVIPYNDQPIGTVSDVMKKVLSPQEERIVVLHVLWGYKHREIARILDCPIGTVTSKYKRAIQKMQTALKEVE